MENLLRQIPNIDHDKIIKESQNDLKQCQKAGEAQAECVILVNQKYIRKFPQMKDLVYPWANYDWDYTTFIDNNYNKNKTGATNRPTFGALFDNISANAKLTKGFIFDANPNKKSRAGVSDLPECNPKQSDYQGCLINNQLKRQQTTQEPPYPDYFFNKPTTGLYSSSYFIKTGDCPKPSLSEKECKEKGYTWIKNNLIGNGRCFKPKYSYIMNKPGIQLDTGDLNEVNRGLGELTKLSTQVWDNADGVDPNASNSLTSDVNRGVAASQSAVETSFLATNAILSLFDGNVPSIMGDGMSINPITLKRVMEGQNTKDFITMKCEGFTSCPNIFVPNKKVVWWSNVLFAILLVSMFIIILNFSGSK